jgi:hypothetical protein
VSCFIYCYAEYRAFYTVMLSVIMLNVVMLSVIMLNVVMLNVVMLIVVAPFKGLLASSRFFSWEFCCHSVLRKAAEKSYHHSHEYL